MIDVKKRREGHLKASSYIQFAWIEKAPFLNRAAKATLAFPAIPEDKTIKIV